MKRLVEQEYKKYPFNANLFFLVKGDSMPTVRLYNKGPTCNYIRQNTAQLYNSAPIYSPEFLDQKKKKKYSPEF